MLRYAKRMLLLSLTAFTLAAGATGVDDANEVPLTPRAEAIADRVEAVAKGYERSPDLALRALFSVGSAERFPDGSFGSREDIPVATLIDQAKGATDPLALDLLLWRCGMRPVCDRVDLATRWTRADTQNQVAWLTLASAQKERGDLAGARETFVRAAQASAWHGHYNDVLRRAADALPSDLSGPERNRALDLLFAKAGATLPFDALQVLGLFCKDPEASRDACARIVATIVRDSDDLMALTVAVPYAARAGMPATTVTSYRQTSEALHWALLQLAAPYAALPGVLDEEDSPALRQAIRLREQRVAAGERRIAEDYLLENHLSEAEAAQRYVATLSETQIAMRSRSMQGR